MCSFAPPQLPRRAAAQPLCKPPPDGDTLALAYGLRTEREGRHLKGGRTTWLYRRREFRWAGPQWDPAEDRSCARLSLLLSSDPEQKTLTPLAPAVEVECGMGHCGQ